MFTRHRLLGVTYLPLGTTARKQGRVAGEGAIGGDARDGRLLGAQLFGRRGSEVAKRVDIFATALYPGLSVEQLSELGLSYTPPLGSPWDAVQMAAQARSAERG